MDRHLFIAVVLLMVTLVGCRSNPSVDRLEAEMRWLEGRVYSLEDELEQRDALLDSVRRENDALRSESRLKSSSDTDDDSDNREGGPPEVILEAPNIDFDEETRLDRDDGRQITAADESDVTDQTVTDILINRMLTGGYDSDGKGGDEGLSLVIEPRNKSEQFVARSGDISVVVLDKSKQGTAARIARWDYTVEEAESLMRKSLFGRGIHLELPWPNEPPANADLRVFVRYKTADGRSLKAQHDFHVELESYHGQVTRRRQAREGTTRPNISRRTIWKPSR